MAAAARKPLPLMFQKKMYHKIHWLVIITYLVAAVAVYLLIADAG